MTLLLLAACLDKESKDSAPVVGLEPPPAGQGFQLAMTSHVEPYTEAWDCAVYEIPIDEVENVNSVVYLNNEGSHHVTLSTLGFNSAGALEPGLSTATSSTPRAPSWRPRP